MSEDERIAKAIAYAQALALAGFGIVEAYPPAYGGGCTCAAGLDCTDPGKHPVGMGWQKKATLSPQTIAERLKRRAGQYGVIPWPGERGLILDVDHPELLPVALPPSLRVRRGAQRGHCYLRLPADSDPKALPATADWGEVRVEGASRHVIGPWSRHASGDVYQPTGEPDTIAEIPAEILAQLFPAPARPRPVAAVAVDGERMPAGWVKQRLDAAGIEYRPGVVRDEITWYDLADCPWHPGEDPWKCGVGEGDNGIAAAHCFHARGADRGWHDFRDKLGLRAPEYDLPKAGPAAVPAAVVSEPEQAAALARCIDAFRRWLHLPDPGALLVTLATVAANRAEGDPVWLLMVAPPGGGKTEFLQPLARLPDVHPAGTLTEAALLSGTPKRDKASDARGGLLRELGAFGIILHKDFGSVLSMHRDTRSTLLAALREIYDGAWTRHVGTDGGRTLHWTGKVGLIAGCTPAIDSHHAVIGSMGERFVLYRLPATDAAAQVRRALGHVGHETTMRAELADAVEQLLGSVRGGWLNAEPDAAAVERLVRISTLAVRCRSAVERDGYSREVLLIPEAEAPARLALTLLRLLNALHAIGADAATAWQLVQKCSLDSMPALRRAVLEELMRRVTVASTTEVAEAVSYPTTTTRRALEDLTAHGVLERLPQGPGLADRWQPTDWARERWGTVPETSGDTQGGAGNGAEPVPISLPLRMERDISGTVPVNGAARDAELVRQVLDITGGTLLPEATA